MAAHEVSAAAVQEWIVENSTETEDRKALAPSSLRVYLGVIAKILDFAELDTNPAHSRILEFPKRAEERVFDPPSHAEFATMVARMGPKHVPTVVVLKGTGLRIGELGALTWGDIDWQGGRIRVAKTKGTPPAFASCRWCPGSRKS